jgi:hypothetical protein
MDPIKIKILKDKYKYRNCNCQCCRKGMKKVLDMFIIKFGKSDVEVTICDQCMENLFTKSLRATTYTNGRLKSKEEVAISSGRYAASFDNKKAEDERLGWEEYYADDEDEEEWEE